MRGGAVGATLTQEAVDAPDAPGQAEGRARRAWGWATRRPMVTVALFATSVAAFTTWHIWHYRTVGTYDPDESGYLANALRYHRVLDFHHLGNLVHEVFATTSAPLVPLLSMVTLILGPRDPRSAMLVNVVFEWITIVAGAALVRRFRGDRAAVLAAIYLAALPMVGGAAEAYWFGLGAAAFALLAVLALAASDRLGNRWSWAYGAAIAAMALSRTMALGFVPALAAAGLWVAWGDRRRLFRLAGALGLAAVLGAPWYVIRRHEVFGYLVGYGYGAKATGWGHAGAWPRVAMRFGRLTNGLLLPGPAFALLVVLCVFGATRLRRAGWRVASLPDGERVALAIALVPVLDMAALLSTRNEGVWFELPMIVVAACVVAIGIPSLPRRWRVVTVLWLAGAIVVSTIVLRVVDVTRVPNAATLYDDRIDAHGGAETDRALAEWHGVNQRLTADLGRVTRDGEVGSVTISGNTYMVNSNTLELEAEEHLWYLRATVPNSTEPVASLERQLTPTTGERTIDGRAKERILVIVRQDRPTFTPDARWPRTEQAARRRGWRTVRRYELPRGGDVIVMRFGHRGLSPARS